MLRPFDRMRRRRHDAACPTVDAPRLTADDVREDLPKLRSILDLATRMLDEVSPCCART